MSVLVEGKPSGHVHMTFTQQPDGSTAVETDSTVEVRVLLKRFRYRIQAKETWKAGRLTSLTSTCNDDGDVYNLTASAEGDSLRVAVNGRERRTRGDVWVTTYWQQPDNSKINQELVLLDADNGRELRARLQYLGVEQRGVAGTVQNLNRYMLTGDRVRMALWYDAQGKLVRQEWTEMGHRTVIETVRIER
jgi:YD repeat-containing protein